MAPTPRQPDAGSQALTDALNISFRLLRWVMLALLVAYLASGVFIVGQREKGFVLVFGKVSGLGADRVKQPGLHWTLPRPLATITNVPTERVQAIESASFWPAGPDLPPGIPGGPGPDSPAKPGRDGYTISGDANLLLSRWVVRYRIDDPEAYLFGFADNEEILRRELDHAVVKSSARFGIDQALRTDIEAFRGAVAAELRDRCAALGLGVRIEGLDLVDVNPPRQVAAAFNDVVAAEQERSERISAARSHAARVTNEAQGEAVRTLAQARAAAQRLVNETGADADYFRKVQEQYAKNPQVIAQTLLQEALRRTLSQVEEKNIVASPVDGKLELRLMLSPPAKPPAWLTQLPPRPGHPASAHTPPPTPPGMPGMPPGP